jgi:hypothetical protein
MTVSKERELVVHMAKEDNSGGNEDSDGASSEHSERESDLQQPAKKKRKAVSYSYFIVDYMTLYFSRLHVKFVRKE